MKTLTKFVHASIICHVYSLLFAGLPAFADPINYTSKEKPRLPRHEAIDYCKQRGQHLPTALELARYAESLGLAEIKPIDSFKEEPPSVGWKQIQAKNRDGSIDRFYYSQRWQSEDNWSSRVWSSSITSYKNEAHSIFLKEDDSTLGIVPDRIEKSAVYGSANVLCFPGLESHALPDELYEMGKREDLRIMGPKPELRLSKFEEPADMLEQLKKFEDLASHLMSKECSVPEERIEEMKEAMKAFYAVLKITQKFMKDPRAFRVSYLDLESEIKSEFPGVSVSCNGHQLIKNYPNHCMIKMPQSTLSRGFQVTTSIAHDNDKYNLYEPNRLDFANFYYSFKDNAKLSVALASKNREKMMNVWHHFRNEMIIEVPFKDKRLFNFFETSMMDRQSGMNCGTNAKTLMSP